MPPQKVPRSTSPLHTISRTRDFAGAAVLIKDMEVVAAAAAAEEDQVAVEVGGGLVE